MLLNDSKFEDNKMFTLSMGALDERHRYLNMIKNEKRVFSRYSQKKQKLFKDEVKYGEYRGISVYSQIEIFHSEFFRFNQT